MSTNELKQPAQTKGPNRTYNCGKQENYMKELEKKERKEIFRVSKEAVTPFWLGMKEYTKLSVDVKFNAPPPDLAILKRQWDKFSSYDKWKAHPKLQS